jgi:hypothetical protein
MYRQNDLITMKTNMDYIKDEAMKKKLDTLEPTLKEFNEVYAIIVDYIKRKNKIIYGGYAQNHLIKLKNKDDVFYKDSDLADIEFYSYEPLKDVVDLCDLLHSKGFKYVQGTDGVHPETYKIFVNFQNYCDLSYMPKNVYDNVPYILDNGIRYTHPHFMLVDAFRVYSDPLTSYFRLDKTFNRFTTLIKYYPFDKSFENNKVEYNTKLSADELKTIKRFVRHKLLHNSQFIVIGPYAYNYLVKKVEHLKLEIDNFTYYQAVSTNYEEDKELIKKFLIETYGKDIEIKNFTPYFQFYDAHTEYYYKNTCIFKLYGHNNRCIVNSFSEKKEVFFGTFQLIFLYLLIDYQYAKTNRNKVEENNYMIMITRLLKAREYYLDKHDITILDKSPFQEFTLQCLGSTEDPLRMAFLKRREKKDAGKQIVFRYDPKGKPGTVPIFRFDNTSGNEILNKNTQV